ncbi:uncharacterized protein [Ptychodera flava]|uniref:uncharacterized protein n=1 Tax=Ptychodera flava TaxID=63121 RepID=UPI00396A3167
MGKEPIDDKLSKGRNVNSPVKSFTLITMACSQILFGGILIFAGIVAINTGCHFAHLGIPMYGGVLSITTGLIGIISATRKTSDMALTTMIFSFMSATFCAVVLVTVMAVGLGAEDSWRYRCDHKDYDCTRTVHKKQAIDTFILMMAVCEAIAAFINGILCSRNCKKCCSQTSQTRSCLGGCCRDGISCCKPTQVHFVLGPAPGSLEPSQISLKTMQTKEGNAIVVLPTDTTEGNPSLVNNGMSNDIENQKEDVNMDASESSPLLD